MTYSTMPESNLVLLLMWRSAAKRRYLALASGHAYDRDNVEAERDRYNALSVQVREQLTEYGIAELDPAVEQEAEQLQIGVDKLLKRIADNSPVGVDLMVHGCRSRWNNSRSMYSLFGVEPPR